MRLLYQIIFLFFTSVLFAQEFQISNVSIQDIHEEILSFKHPNWKLDKVLKVTSRKKLTDKISSVNFGSDSMGAILNDKGEVINTFKGTIEKFTSLLFVIKYGKTYRLMNQDGHFTSNNIYNSVKSIYQCYYFKVTSNGRSGILNESGKEIFPLFNYSKLNITLRSSRLSRVNIDKAFEPYLEALNRGESLPEYYIFPSETGFGIKDQHGKIIIPAEYPYIELPSNNRILVHNGEYYGFLNMKNELVIDYQFSSAYSFRCERAKVSIRDPREKNVPSKFGFINIQGKLIIDYKYEDRNIKNFYKDYAIYKDDALFGIIDKKGNIKVEPKFKQIKSFEEPGIAEVKVGDKTGFINANGEPFINIEYRDIDTDYELVGTSTRSLLRRRGTINYFLLEKYGKRGICDNSGNIIIPVEQEYINRRSSTYIKISNGDKSYCIDDNFNEILKEDSYVGLRCNEHFGEISIDGTKKKFFYPKDNEPITKYYDGLYTKGYGYYFATIQDSTAIIDANHSIILPFAPRRKYVNIIPSNLVIVRENKNMGNYGIEDFNGRSVLSMIYKDITLENENYFSVFYDGQLAYFKNN